MSTQQRYTGINKLKPYINQNDKATGKLTIEISELGEKYKQIIPPEHDEAAIVCECQECDAEHTSKYWKHIVPIQDWFEDWRKKGMMK